MPASTLTSKGQITVPKAVRDALSLNPGDRLNFHLHADGTVTVEAETVDLTTLRGVLRSRAGHVSLDDMQAAIRRRASKG